MIVGLPGIRGFLVACLVPVLIAEMGGVARAQVSDDRLLQTIEERDRVIERLTERVEILERQVRTLQRLSDEDLDQITGAGKPPVSVRPPVSLPLQTTTAAVATPSSQQPQLTQPSGSESPQGGEAQAPEERDVTRVALAPVERGGNLLNPGNVQIESHFGYAYSRSTRLIFTGFSVIPLVILGTLESEKSTADFLTSTSSLRYGVMKDFQLDLSVPTSYETDTRVRLSNDRVGLTRDKASQFGFGDIDAGVSYQPLYERGWLPDVTTSLRLNLPVGRSQFDIFKSMTKKGPFAGVEDFVERLSDEGLAVGSGFWALTGRVSMVKAFDPAVLYGNIGYTHRIPRNVTLVEIDTIPEGGAVKLVPAAIKARVSPGDSLSFGLGFALALNNQFSVNFGFSNNVSFPTKRDGRKITDSNLSVAQFNTGFNLALTRRLSISLSWGIGLSPDAPDFSVGVGVPMSFDSLMDLLPIKNLPFGLGRSSPPPAS